ncbi:sec1 family domain-containing protein 1 [Trichonephila inaurata madagascariensis]|uniref:Protein sly1 homolog n=1 Tax=Trichonephila inaurata madagascariensis TaxID=2747483 RepID=A0A8X6I4S2_9ARAC|nr:sec1 family domain-containing protein 1 [Trichonephila inaurata madagascariensis]
MGSVMREKQINALKRMLNFNVNVSKASVAEPVWKVLVYDRYGQDIISPLLSVKDLRDLGVTLHLLLHSDRETIPDVPVVYFVMPNEENITRIAQDFRNQLYDSFYLNFISPISRQRLEDLASAAILAGCVSSINSVFDQYLNFITLENDMFILKHQDRSSLNYYAINRGDMKDTEMEILIDNIVDSLFSVFVTLGVVPIIRCPRGNAAEMVSEKLDKKIRENLRDTRNSLFAPDGIPSSFSFQRPLLVILDRNQDMATPLHHTWTYQALAHDVLDLQLNRVSMDEVNEKTGHLGAKPRKRIKTYDLSPSDKFWMQYKGSPFPIVAEAVQEELDAYRSSEEEVKRLKTAMGLDASSGADEVIGSMSDNTAKLTSAVSSLPELLEKKRLIDMHMSVATAILDHIKSRKLDVYFEIEEKIMGRATLEKSLMDMITDPEAGLPSDKLRLFLISFICGPAMTEAEVDQYITALQDAGCDVESIQYMRRWKTYSKLSSHTASQYSGGTKTVSMFSKLMSHGSQLVMEGVKNLVVKKHNLPITRIVDSLMEMKSLPETDDYKYFDPKLLRPTDSASVPRNRSPFQDAVVFVVGGGNYIEYQNLIDYTKGKTTPVQKKIIYGSTDLVNADHFIKQLHLLGTEIQ